MKNIQYFTGFSILGAVLLGAAFGGKWLAVPALYVFGLLPLLDVVCGRNKANPEATDPRVNRSAPLDLPLWLWVPCQLSILAYGLSTAGNAERTPLELLGLTLSVGIMGGVSINVSHELLHRRGKLERCLAELSLTSVSYAHFAVEHVLGHHRRVATPEDPASAALGARVYPFVVRSVFGGLASAWQLEGARVRRLGRRWLGLSDRRLRYPLGLVAAYGVAFALSGWLGMLLMAGQSMVAIFLLEVINYIEHYGLRRQQIAPGKYERVWPHHSWNASERLSNWFLFNLQRHSDHHFAAARPYWQLRHHEEAPQLPFGYAAAIPIALLPPLWRAIMDPRVEAWRTRTAEAAAAQDAGPAQ